MLNIYRMKFLKTSFVILIMGFALFFQSCLEESPKDTYVTPEYKTSSEDFEKAIKSEEAVSFGYRQNSESSLSSTEQTNAFTVTIDLSEQEPLNEQQMEAIYKRVISAAREHLLNLEDHDVLEISVEFNNGEVIKKKEYEVASLLRDK